jgi:hypothetical protein
VPDPGRLDGRFSCSPPLLGLSARFLVLFPDGQPPSARWHRSAWAISIVGLVTAVAVALLLADEGSLPGNPLAMEGLVGRVAEAIADLGVTVLFLAVVVAAVSLLLRFRRAPGQHRQQLKWLAYGGAFLAWVIVLDLVSQEPPGSGTCWRRGSPSALCTSASGCSSPRAAGSRPRGTPLQPP